MGERKLVRDLMSIGVFTCSPDTPVPDLARALLQKNLEAAVVLDTEGHAIGVVSQDDLIRVYSQDDCRQLTAEGVMSEGVPQVPPDIPLATAAQIMRDRGIRVLFMMHHADGISYPAAVLSYYNLLRHIAAQDDEDLSDLGIKAARENPVDTFIQKRDAARRRAGLSNQE